MGTNRRSVDEAYMLENLSPFEIFPYAVGFKTGLRYLRKPGFRRYRTEGHAKAAAKGLIDSKLYQFNFDTDKWEVME